MEVVGGAPTYPVRMTPMPRDKFYETEEFATVNKEWQARLRASGFDDLEDDFAVSHKRDLKSTVYLDRDAARRGELSGLAEHYRRAGRYLHERVWPTLARKVIWELYCEGVPRLEACQRMGTLPGHQPWYMGEQLAEERALMAQWYAEGGDPEDEVALSLHDEELANNGDFRHIPTRGEGGGSHGAD